MTEPKNEKNEVVTQEQNGLFNYVNKLPDNLTNKDMDWLRKRITNGLFTDTIKSKKIKSAIKIYMEDKANLKEWDKHLFVALFCAIGFSIGFSFGNNELKIYNLFLPLGMAICSLAGNLRNNANAFAAYSLVNNKSAPSVAEILYRNVMPVLVVLLPAYWLYGLLESHQNDPATLIDRIILIAICLGAYGLRKISEILVKDTFKKYNIEE